MKNIPPQTQSCIEQCLKCYATCTFEAMNHCLEAGGAHVEPTHFRLMASCAEICRTSAHFMLIGVDQHKQICAACAAVCRECAASCEGLDGMEECARICRSCADSCERMAA